MITRTLRWTLCRILLTTLISRDIHRFGPGVVFPWVVVAACFGGLLWLRSRLETRLSRPVYTALAEAVRALPPNTPLVDYETGDRLAITGNRWLGLPDGWWIDRIPREPSGEDAMSDFQPRAAGQHDPPYRVPGPRRPRLDQRQRRSRHTTAGTGSTAGPARSAAHIVVAAAADSDLRGPYWSPAGDGARGLRTRRAATPGGAARSPPGREP